MQLTVDLSQLDPRTRERIVRNAKHEDVAQYHLACLEQAKAAQYYRQYAAAGVTKTDFGPVQMAIHPYFRNQLSATASAQKERVWMDPDFGKWLLNRQDEFRVPIKGTRIQSGWTPQSQKISHRVAESQR